MNISFRAVAKKDMTALRLTDRDWKRLMDRRRYGSSGGDLPSRVVTIDGVVVLGFAANGQVCFQDDRFPIADLMRADKRVWEAATLVSSYDVNDLRREQSGKPTGMDLLREAVRP